MSQENLQIVRSILAAWERGDYSSVEWAHPEIEYEVIGGPEPGRWTGLAGMAASHREVLAAFGDFRIEAEDYRQLDDERVLALTRSSGRGKTSGLEIARMGTDTANLFDIRGGKVSRLVLYFDRERAFADLRLTE